MSDQLIKSISANELGILSQIRARIEALLLAHEKQQQTAGSSQSTGLIERQPTEKIGAQVSEAFAALGLNPQNKWTQLKWARLV